MELLEGVCSTKHLNCIRSSFKFLQISVGDIYLNEIDVRKVEKFILMTFKRAEYSCHLYFRILRAAFNKALSWDYISSNPFTQIKPPKLKKRLPLFISSKELDLILAETKETFLKDIFLFAYNTGMRLGEIVNLQWNSIDFVNKVIKVSNTATFTTKSKKEREIPINKTVNEILSQYIPIIQRMNQKQYVFWRIKGIRLNEDYVSKKFKKAVREAKLNDDIHFHTLRHSTASKLVQKGISIYVVKEILGHEDIKTTQIYSHLSNDSLASAMELL